MLGAAAIVAAGVALARPAAALPVAHREGRPAISTSAVEANLTVPPGPATARQTSVLDPLTPVIAPLPAAGNALGGLAGGLARDSANAALDAVAAWVAAGAASLLGALATEIDRTTTARTTQSWLVDHFDVMRGIGVLFAFPLLFATAITAIVRRDAGVLLRAVFLHLPVALIGTGAAMAVVGLALAATDALCGAVTGGTGADTAALLRGLTQGLERGGPGVTGFGLVLVALLVASGGFLLTIELVVRDAAIWVAVLFLPLGLVGLVWPGTARWSRRLGELLTVLILSKFVIVAIVSMAVSATSAGVNGSDGPSLLGGAALLLLAAAAPFTLLRMVPLVEAGVVAHLDGVGRRAATLPPAVQQAVQPDALRRLLDGRGATELGPPSGPPGPVAGGATPIAVATRGRDPDGTQSGEDKPVPALSGMGQEPGAWRSGVRLIGAATGSPAPAVMSFVVPPSGASGADPGHGRDG